jgi:hypothetical protein
MFLRHPGFHGRILRRTLERLLNTDVREIAQRPVSTSFPTNFHDFSIPFRNSDGRSVITSPFSLLIQISSPKRNNNAFPSVINKPMHLISRYSNNRVLSRLRASSMTLIAGLAGCARPSHQTRKPFYITTRRQKNPPSRENYACELHQVMIMRLLRVGRTSC